MKATYTHGYHPAVLKSHSNRTIANSAAYLEPYLQHGLSLLDVGSGAGTITAEFAARLGANHVTALEVNAQACALTRHEVEQKGFADVRCVVGDVHKLDLPDNSFDVVHAHQVLQHVHDPVLALKEMRRVCKPGGVVAVRDSDYAGFVWYPQLPALDLWLDLYTQAARANGGEPNAGRYLLAWAKKVGFSHITSTSSTWCLATDEARQWWGGMWAERILHSKIAEQLLQQGLAMPADLQVISNAWLTFAQTDDAWMSLLHAELICRK